MTEKTTLCIECRATYTDAEIETAECCPNCKTTGLPADLRLAHTLTFTDHEWRVLFMWADNYSRLTGETRCINVVRAIRDEACRQCPNLPTLTLHDELESVATRLQRPVEVITAKGQRSPIKPHRLH